MRKERKPVGLPPNVEPVVLAGLVGVAEGLAGRRLDEEDERMLAALVRHPRAAVRAALAEADERKTSFALAYALRVLRQDSTAEEPPDDAPDSTPSQEGDPR